MAERQRSQLDSDRLSDVIEEGAESEHIVLESEQTDVPTLTDTQVNAVLTKPLAEVVVVTRSAELRGVLEPALATTQPTFVTDLKGLSSVLKERPVGVVLLDAAIDRRAQKLVEKLKSAHPEIAIIVASERAGAEPFMPLLSQGVVHRFLIKPASPGQARLLVSAGLKRHGELMASRHEPAGRKPVDERSVTLSASSPAKSPPWMWLGGAAVGVVAVALVALLVSSGDDTAVSGEAATAPAPSAAAQENTSPSPASPEEELVAADSAAVSAGAPDESPANPDLVATLDRAAAAYSTGDWFSDEGTGAYELWRQVEAEDPNNAAAQAGLNSLADTMAQGLEQSLVLELIGEAEVQLAQLRQAFPDYPRLQFLSVQVERGRQQRDLAEQTLADASEAALVQDQEEALAELVPQISAALEAGQLIEPAQTSAAALIARAREIDPSAGDVLRFQEQILLALGERLNAAIDAENSAAAQRWQAALAANGADAQTLAAAESRITTLQRSQDENYLAGIVEQANTAIAAGSWIEPAGESVRDHLAELQQLDPDNAQLVNLQADFALGLNREFAQALAAEDWQAAASWLEALQLATGAQETARQAESRLQQARRQSELMQEVVPASVLTLVEYEPPDYPRSAVRRGQEGWVDLQMTVNTLGLPENVLITGSEPAGVFDAAALDVSQNYRFQPYEEDGVPFARRVVMKIRFALE